MNVKYENKWVYHLKNIGTRIGIGLSTVALVFGWAPPKTKAEWGLVAWVFLLSVAGAVWSAKGAKTVAK